MGWLPAWNCNKAERSQGSPSKPVSSSSSKKGRESASTFYQAPQTPDQASIHLMGLQSFVVFFLLARPWGLWPKLRIPQHSKYTETISGVTHPNSHYRDRHWPHHTELQPWVRSQVCWFPDKYWPVGSFRLASKSHRGLWGALCIWQSCIKLGGRSAGKAWSASGGDLWN